MALNFFPKVIKFFDLFKKQNEVMFESISSLNDIFSSYKSVPELCKKIIDKETEGDLISRDISISLAQTFITPIDREDIHALNMAQEKVLNSIRAISTRIGLYHFDKIKPGAKELISILKGMHEEISIMVGSLQNKLDITKSTGKVRKLKFEAEMLLLVSMGEVYENHPEGSMNFLELVKWSHIYDRIEEVYDNTETLSNVIEGIYLKYS